MTKASAPRRDPERTQADLLAVATEEFARDGFFGARVDKIAARSRTTKRMIYYYFQDKRGLYTAVLEKAYADIRAREQELELTDMAPSEAMERLIRHTIDYHDSHPAPGPAGHGRERYGRGEPAQVHPSGRPQPAHHPARRRHPRARAGQR